MKLFEKKDNNFLPLTSKIYRNMNQKEDDNLSPGSDVYEQLRTSSKVLLV